ncbi:MAG: VOC family protein [Anaeromyxobacter sp.]
MPELSHFAIHADDPARARAFYERVFGWAFEVRAPGVFALRGGAGAPRMEASIQARRELNGRAVHGFECTVAVDDLDAVETAAVAAGGKLLGARTTLPGVGELRFIEDTEGNVVGAMRYAPGAR